MSKPTPAQREAWRIEDTPDSPSAQLSRAREAGAAVLTDLEVAQERIESLSRQLTTAHDDNRSLAIELRLTLIENGKLLAEVNRLDHLLSDFARDQMQDKARARKQAGAVRQMFASARLRAEPTGGWVNTARGRVFIEVRKI